MTVSIAQIVGIYTSTDNFLSAFFLQKHLKEFEKKLAILEIVSLITEILVKNFSEIFKKKLSLCNEPSSCKY